MGRTQNLFISHSWTYGDAYDRLCDLLRAAPNFSYRDYSVPKDDPIHIRRNGRELYDAIKGQIVFCEVVIIMAGVYATYSDWIQKEIAIAKEDFDKPLLAVRPWANKAVSSVVANAADEIVAWNTGSIVSAIRRLAP